MVRDNHITFERAIELCFEAEILSSEFKQIKQDLVNIWDDYYK